MSKTKPFTHRRMKVPRAGAIDEVIIEERPKTPVTLMHTPTNKALVRLNGGHIVEQKHHNGELYYKGYIDLAKIATDLNRSLQDISTVMLLTLAGYKIHKPTSLPMIGKLASGANIHDPLQNIIKRPVPKN